MYLYLLTNAVNGKQYVGITTRPVATRLRKHFFVALRGRKTLIAHAMRKYGKEAFAVDILGEATDYDELKRMEQAAIGLYNTFHPAGYNLTRGGDGTVGWVHTEEARQRMSVANQGRVRTEEHKAAVSKAQLGVPKSPETRAKMSEGQRGEKNHQFGKTLTEEHRQILREANTGVPHNLGRTLNLTPEQRANRSVVSTGRKHTPEAKEKISASKRGKPRSAETKAKMWAGRDAYMAEHGSPLKGQTLSVEHRAKLSDSLQGKEPWNKGKKVGPLSEEHRAKLSLAHQGHEAWNKGVPHTEETKAKMVAAHAAVPHPRARAIVYNDVVYPSIMDAVRATGLSKMQMKYRLQQGRAHYVDEHKE